MSGRAAEVLVDDVEVGELIEDDNGYVEFRISERYRAMTGRPVVGQWFEDQRHGVQRGERPGDLPSFFANVIPEGDLRYRIGSRLGVAPDDDFGFLCAVGTFQARSSCERGAANLRVTRRRRERTRRPMPAGGSPWPGCS